MIPNLNKLIVRCFSLSKLSTTASLICCVTLVSTELSAHEKMCSLLFTEGHSKSGIISTGLVGEFENKALELQAQGLHSQTDQILTSALGGVAFQILRQVHRPGEKAVIEKNEPHYSYYRNEEAKLLSRLPLSASQELKELIGELLHPQTLADGSIAISIRSNGWHALYRSARKGQNPMFAYFVQSKFEILYRHMATWIYQLEGLEPHMATTSAKMTDEQLDYSKEKIAFDYVLLFDPQVWETQMRFLEYQWRITLQNPHEPSSTADLRMTDLKGLWPLSGLASARSQLNSESAVELKRYFKNSCEDPFGFLELKAEKDDYNLRQEMIIIALENLPRGTVVQIHSHTRIHTLAYRKLGFVIKQRTVNPKYPDASVDLLESTNDVVIQKIKARLSMREAIAPVLQDN